MCTIILHFDTQRVELLVCDVSLSFALRNESCQLSAHIYNNPTGLVQQVTEYVTTRSCGHNTLTCCPNGRNIQLYLFCEFCYKIVIFKHALSSTHFTLEATNKELFYLLPAFPYRKFCTPRSPFPFVLATES